MISYRTRPASQAIPKEGSVDAPTPVSSFYGLGARVVKELAPQSFTCADWLSWDRDTQLRFAYAVAIGVDLKDPAADAWTMYRGLLEDHLLAVTNDCEAEIKNEPQAYDPGGRYAAPTQYVAPPVVPLYVQPDYRYDFGTYYPGTWKGASQASLPDAGTAIKLGIAGAAFVTLWWLLRPETPAEREADRARNAKRR